MAHDATTAPPCRTAPWTRRVPPAAALAATVIFTAVVSLGPPDDRRFPAAGATLLLAYAAAARVPPRPLLARMLLLEPLAIGVAVLALFGPGGWARFTTLLLRSNVCIAAVLVLAALVPFPAILGAMRAFRVPSLLVSTLGLTHRYLFVLGDEMRRMMRARRSRTFAPSRRAEWRASASIAAQSFVRSTGRAGRISAAMYARGWKP